MSASGWPGTADNQFSSIRILGSRFGLRLSVVAHFAVWVGCDGQNSGVSQCAFAPLSLPAS